MYTKRIGELSILDLLEVDLSELESECPVCGELDELIFSVNAENIEEHELLNSALGPEDNRYVCSTDCLDELEDELDLQPGLLKPITEDDIPDMGDIQPRSRLSLECRECGSSLQPDEVKRRSSESSPDDQRLPFSTLILRCLNDHTAIFEGGFDMTGTVEYADHDTLLVSPMPDAQKVIDDTDDSLEKGEELQHDWPLSKVKKLEETIRFFDIMAIHPEDGGQPKAVWVSKGV